jgi:hypothetical protein
MLHHHAHAANEPRGYRSKPGGVADSPSAAERDVEETMKDEELVGKQTTYFHLPDDAPYDPIHAPTRKSSRVTVNGFVPVARGSEVTIHGVGRFEVARTAFHVGHPDEQPGLHVFLTEIELI